MARLRVSQLYSITDLLFVARRLTLRLHDIVDGSSMIWKPLLYLEYG